MPQLHLYVPEGIARELRRRAEAAGLTLSRYLARIVQREVVSGWPAGYFEDVVGSWRGEPLVRPARGEADARDTW